MSPGDRVGADAKAEASAGKRRFGAMAAVVALATVAGALGGALATAGIGKLIAGDAAQASVQDTALETSVARLDAEIVALKASLEHNSKATTGQINRASDRLDKVEKAQAEPAAKLAKLRIRKGSRAMQQLPASPDAFVWLRLYQQQMRALVPDGPDDPLWWTLQQPFRPLGYHAARAMFVRANDAAGTGWTLHDLRHTAAYRLARDPAVPITDVQWVLGHQSLSTTQLYVSPGG